MTTTAELVEADARSQVAAYLRALGLPDGPHSHALVKRVLDQDAGRSSTSAVHTARRMTSGFLEQVQPQTSTPTAHWLPVFLRTQGESFPDDPCAAARFAAGWNRPESDVYRGFEPQDLGSARPPGWLAVTAVPLTLAVAVPVAAARAVAPGAPIILVAAWAILIGVLTFVVAAGATAAALGFVTDPALFGRWRRPLSPASADQGGRVAVLVPIYEEDPVQIFGMLVALWEGLQGDPDAGDYDFFVLSDTRRPELVRRELRTLSWVRHRGAPGMPLSYRRRAANGHKKAGNLAEFMGTAGNRYIYAVVLDADSVMRPATVAEMVRRMRADPRLGLLQAPLEIHRAQTLFARAQQFTSATVGPLAARGLAVWAGDDGNYYGHNAVIRIAAFRESCRLPELGGSPPLGGQLLSHDFVEAALLCRRGWRVRTAADLTGSWEQCPPTLEQFVTRDRRWSQGNLQHLRLLATAGLRPMSRLHLFLGAACYLASPALLVFTGLGLVVSAVDPGGSAGRVGLVLTAGAIAALLVPRILGWLSVAGPKDRAQRFGGRGRVTAGAVVDTVVALTLGPVMLIHHTLAVLSVLAGRAAGWEAQVRDGRSQSPGRTARDELAPTAFGVAAAAGLAIGAPGALWWLAPLWLPMVAAVPLALVVSSERIGLGLRRAGVLTVPVERDPDPVELRMDALMRAMRRTLAADELHDVVVDPLLLDEHCRMLETSATPVPAGLPADRTALRLLAAIAGPEVLDPAERALLLQDAAALRWLHEHAWPVWNSQLTPSRFPQPAPGEDPAPPMTARVTGIGAPSRSSRGRHQLSGSPTVATIG